MSKSVAIIGSGISGTLTAYFLAKRGYAVNLYEKEAYAAMQCSYANGGQISVCNSKTWNDIPTLKKAIKWLFKKDAPLLVRFKPSYRKISWLSKFLFKTLKDGNYVATYKTIQMGIQSRTLLKELVEEEGIEFDQSYSGMMHLYTQDADYRDSLNDDEYFNHHGCKWDNIGLKEILTLEPALKDFKDIISGSFIQDDWSGDIHKFCTEMQKVLQSKYGVKYCFGYDVKDIKDLDEDYIVLANGHAMYDFSNQLGETLDVYPVKGYSITINLNDETSKAAAPIVPLIDNNKKIVCSRLGDKFRVAGTAEFNDVNYDIIKDRIQPLLDWVHKNFPDIDTSDYNQWACLRPMTPDMMPIVRKAKNHDKVFLNGGHGHLGWTLSAYTGNRIADLIDGSN